MTKKSKRRTVHLDQWIEIEQVEGRSAVTRYPPNDELEELRKKMDPPAELIYRRMFFHTKLPTEYSDLDPTSRLECGGLILQRILPDEWVTILALEQAGNSDAMVLPRNPQPRPEEFGPCPCPECTQEREKGLKSRYDS
jgi:hypothetical protein